MLQKFESDSDIKVIVEGLPIVEGQLKVKIEIMLTAHIYALRQAIENDELDLLAEKYHAVMVEMIEGEENEIT